MTFYIFSFKFFLKQYTYDMKNKIRWFNLYMHFTNSMVELKKKLLKLDDYIFRFENGD